MKYFNILGLIILLPWLSGASTNSYQENQEALKWKKFFDDMEVQAIAEPYKGIRGKNGIETGLFPIRSTGVSTRPVVEAARNFLDSLRPDQQLKTVFSVDDPEWRKWSNVDNGIYVRQGISLKEMTPEQRSAAMKLMKESLSAKGLALTEAIRKTDHTLSEINNNILSYDENLYFFTLMGLPSETEPWGWQIDGHHLVINYFVMGDQVVMTPSFFGAEPAVTTTGKYKGNAVLQDEQDQGLAFYRMLDADQKAKATFGKEKTKNNNKAEAFHDNLELDYTGVSASELSEDQRLALVNLISLYVGNLREGHARVWMEDVKAHLDKTWFLWEGDASDTGKFYYRIHSPVILIEFDHQLPVGTTRLHPSDIPTRDHIHVVVRTPNGNDYGKDLLRQHLERYHH